MQVHLYDTEIEWIGEKKGQATAGEFPPLEIATPPEFQGHEGIWTPEHVLVASVNSCLMTTFLAVAEMSKLDFVAFRSQAQGKLEKVEGQGFQITEVVLRPHITISHERDRERVERVLEKAEKNCFISNSIKAEVRLEPTFSVSGVDPRMNANEQEGENS